VIKVCAPFLGRGFGLGVITASALACSGATFKGAPADPDETDTTDPVVSTRGGSTSSTPRGSAGKPPTKTTGGMTTGGMTTGGASGASGAAEAGSAPVAPPQQGGNHTGGGAGGAGGSSGAAGAVTTAGAGGTVVLPPDQGAAGWTNIPDPPVEPTCAAPLAEGWTAAIGSSGSNWEIAFGDPWVDVANHRLVVTYDDVAGRKSAYEGGYYVATEVTLEGGTVLTPNPFANELRWPSLRRNSTGVGVELGATRYGTSESWTSNDWAGFSGTTIGGTKTVSLTTYVKATAQAVAVKVSYGGQTYRSGWLSGFTWAQTNLGIIRFTGENNSRVYAGDAVYVGPLSGCQKLTDAAVEALFND
jgi:hypothetical protein